MSVIEIVAVIALAFWIWTLLTPGLTYLLREATIFNFVRLPLVFKLPWFAKLFGCGQCTSTWTGMAAYAVLLPVVGVFVETPTWLWFCTPIAGVCGTGLFDRMARSSLAGPIDRLVKVLQQPVPQEVDSSDASGDGPEVEKHG